jgi:hypothetical protein
MSEQERETAGSDTPDELDPEVEAHLVKEALAAGAAAATMFAGTSVAGAVVQPGPGGAGPAVVDPGPGGAGGAVVDPGPGGAGGGAVDPGAGGAGAAVDPGPDAVDRAVTRMQAAKAAAAKAKARSAAKKPPLEP